MPPACFQPEFAGIISYSDMSEDCLYVSFWVPESAASAKLPIIVYIHGGAFVNGATQYYNGSYFAQQGNVIIVSVQYRLGMLGFMGYEAFRTKDGVGNLGLLDQLEALRWVKQNMAQFGGDVNLITLMGESAGGASVMIHQATNPDPLFHHTITMSGVFDFAVAKPLDEAHQIAQDHIDALECDSGDEQKVIECLKMVDPRIIVNKTTPPPEVYTIQPTIDNVLIKKSINEYYKSGDFAKMPSIVGSTKEEFSTSICLRFKGQMDYKTLVHMLEQDFEKKASLDSILHTYNLTAGSQTNYIDDYVRIKADSVMHCPTRRTIASIAKKETYSYFYTFGHKFGFAPECIGAAHSLDLISLFPVSFLRAIGIPSYQLTEDEKILGENMVQFFSNFAASGNVNSRMAMQSHQRKPLQCFFWSPYTPDTDMDMYFDTWSKMDRRKHFYKEVCALW
eukprot:CAMPEP_0117447732 /NCGR_PEP_ID=MMETSP0759-20121206/7031_1 /TAXON_ID=63605 /ORGANISM="Percolomonas cosmopolitus, Strain WS" /LENGTH=449 /DNA_ID=CAMNT_0005240085 /DNA_START=233 /DNA_END=1579 /DNA_ORIENTATION=+